MLRMAYGHGDSLEVLALLLRALVETRPEVCAALGRRKEREEGKSVEG